MLKVVYRCKAFFFPRIFMVFIPTWFSIHWTISCWTFHWAMLLSPWLCSELRCLEDRIGHVNNQPFLQNKLCPKSPYPPKIRWEARISLCPVLTRLLEFGVLGAMVVATYYLKDHDGIGSTHVGFIFQFPLIVAEYGRMMENYFCS